MVSRWVGPQKWSRQRCTVLSRNTQEANTRFGIHQPLHFGTVDRLIRRILRSFSYSRTDWSLSHVSRIFSGIPITGVCSTTRCNFGESPTESRGRWHLCNNVNTGIQLVPRRDSVYVSIPVRIVHLLPLQYDTFSHNIFDETRNGAF